MTYTLGHIKVDNNSYNFEDVIKLMGCCDASGFARRMYRQKKYLYRYNYCVYGDEEFLPNRGDAFAGNLSQLMEPNKIGEL